MKRVWRIGTNWGSENIFPVFKKYSIVFVGVEAADQILQIRMGDLLCITNGQEIVAICKAIQIVPFNQIDSILSTKYNNVNVIKVESIIEKSAYPEIDFGIYGGRGKKFSEAHGTYKTLINNNFNEINRMKNSKDIIELLQFKKQIILQGPPGTGKTRLAQEIAKKISLNSEISDEDILNTVYVNLDLLSTSNRKSKYTVKKIYDEKIEYFIHSTGGGGTLKFEVIKKAFKDKIWLNGSISNGLDTYSAAFAKYIYENLESDQVKIIQFHPSYSYEDFVRGITVKSEGDKVVYETQNRILAEFAAEAYNNQIDSSKEITDYSHEKFIEGQINAFAESISDSLGRDEEVKISNSIRIIDVEANAFKFIGKDWYDKIKFDQLKRMILLGIRSSDQLKSTSGFAKTVYHRITYYLSVLEKLREFSPSIDIMPEVPSQIIPLKNYVLIIDEINRANLPSVLGELIYALEYRNKRVNSMYSIDGENGIILPKNLYIIGTMNTSDRSVGHLDYAIRRRFAFVDVLPQVLTIENFQNETFKIVSKLFIKNFDAYSTDGTIKLEKSECLNDEFRPEDVWLGHSYFIAKDNEFKIRKKYEIVPILNEYVKDGILKDVPATWEIIDEL